MLIIIFHHTKHQNNIENIFQKPFYVKTNEALSSLGFFFFFFLGEQADHLWACILGF
jgi:hypothetical protein